MPPIQTRPNALPNASLIDGLPADALGERSGSTVVAKLHGNFYTQNYRGNVFLGTTAVGGVVLQIYTGLSSTTFTYGIWNPLGSGKNLVPIRVALGYVGTTSIAGNIVYSYLPGVGSAIGVPISTFTKTTPISCNLGGGGVSVANFSAVAAGIVIPNGGGAPNPTLLKTSGINQFALTAGGTTQGQWTSTEDFDGSLIIPPGVLFLVAGNVAQLATFDVATTWEEVPV